MTVTNAETLELMPTTAQEAFERAMALHKDEQLSEAQALYERTLALDSEHAGALCHLGLLRLQQGKADESANLLRQAISKDPNSADAHSYLGGALQRLGALYGGRDPVQSGAIARSQPCWRAGLFGNAALATR